MNNQLTLIGHVGQTPRNVVFGDSKNAVAKFSLGVKEFGNKEESTMWIDCDAWNGVGERVMEYVTKGREVVVTGRLVINHFKKEVDGVTVEVSKPILNVLSFHLCGPKPQTEDASGQESAADTASKTRRSRKAS